MNTDKRILLLANQPFQVELMRMVAQFLIKNNFIVYLGIGDFFTPTYGPDLLFKAKLTLGDDKVFDLGDLFLTLQAKGEPKSDDLQFAEKILTESSKLKSRGRDFGTILKTDGATNGFEDSAWYLTISEDWKKIYYSRLIEWCYEILEVSQPNLIVSIENSLLTINILHSIAEFKIDWLLFSNSRVGNRWITNEDFLYGMSNSQYKKIIEKEFDKEVIKQSELYLNGFISGKTSLYETMKEHLVENAPKKIRKFRDFKIVVIPDFYNWGINAIRTLILGPRTRKLAKSRKVKVRRFDQSFTKLQIFEFKRKVVRHFVKTYNIDLDFLVNKKYILWLLHYRPEGSGLIQGDGCDEIEILGQLSKLLPDDVILIVKEQTGMIGMRNRGFYRKIWGNKNVFMVAPNIKGRDLIEDSIGVVGISGTILLEAAFCGKASYAFGKPEFIKFVYSREDMEIKDFLEKLLHENLTSKPNLIKYLQYILSESSEEDQQLSFHSSVEKMEKDAERIAHKISEKIELVVNK